MVLGYVGFEATYQVMGGVRPALAAVMTRGNGEFRAVEVVVDRGGCAGVPGGLTTECLGVLCRARHLDLLTGEVFVCDCRASSQGKTVGARVESREPRAERGTLSPGAASREPRAESRKEKLAGGSWQRAARCRVWNVECGLRNDKGGTESRVESWQLGNRAAWQLGEGRTRGPGDKETRGRTAQGRVVGIQKAAGSSVPTPRAW